MEEDERLVFKDLKVGEKFTLSGYKTKYIRIKPDVYGYRAKALTTGYNYPMRSNREVRRVRS